MAALTGTAFAQEEGEEMPADDTATDDGTMGEPAGDGAPMGDPAMEPAPAAAGGKVVGVDAAVVLPLSNYGDVADLAIGALGRFEFGINPALAVTARAGLLYHIGTPEGLTFMIIPIFAGVKYNIGTSGLFGFGELGIAYARASTDAGSASETNFGVNVGAGYQMGKIQARAGLLLPDIGEAGDILGIMATVGFDVASL